VLKGVGVKVPCLYLGIESFLVYFYLCHSIKNLTLLRFQFYISQVTELTAP
jgi:hypothetical protein